MFIGAAFLERLTVRFELIEEGFRASTECCLEGVLPKTGVTEHFPERHERRPAL